MSFGQPLSAAVRFATIGVFAFLLVLPSGARAESPKIALVTTQPGDPIAARLRAELGALGFEIVEAEERSPAPGREPLEQHARAAGAVAAIRVVPSSRGVEVWIVDRVTGKTLLREVVDSGATISREATIAVRAVELLRASLLEIQGPHPSRGEIEADATVRALAELPSPLPAAASEPAARPMLPPSLPAMPRDSRAPHANRGGGPRRRSEQARGSSVGLELSSGAILSPGGVPPAPVLRLGVQWMPSERVGGALFGLLPVVGSAVEGTEGTADVRIGMLGASLRALLAAPEAAWLPSAEAGLAVAWLHLEGRARAPFISGSDDILVAAPHLRAGLGYALGHRATLRADVLAAATLPRAVVHFAGREVAAWGRPVFVTSLGLELRWP